MIAETEKLVQELDVRIPSAHATIRDLSGGQRQGVAIARATHWANKLILLDEPTAALGVAETARVEEIVRSLKSRNIGVLIVSHSLDQVFRLADRICVLRRGNQIGVRDTAEHRQERDHRDDHRTEGTGAAGLVFRLEAPKDQRLASLSFRNSERRTGFHFS